VQDEIDDDLLIARAAGGDRAAFERLLDRHAPAMLRLARAVTPDDATAADVVQEASFAAYKSAGTYRPGVSSVRTWLFAIARNAARKVRRSMREEPMADADDTPLLELGVRAGWGADEATGRFEQHELLVRALATLAPDELELVLLRDIEGLSGEEAAQVLALRLPALKSRLHRARLRLMAAMRTAEGGVVENQQEKGGLACGQVLAVLGEYVDGELPAAARAQVDAHLRDCTVCERFGGRYASVVESARARLGAAPAVPAAHLDRIRRALG
jgi:RNA polymerase sigma-70 factor, ECF subfamily